MPPKYTLVIPFASVLTRTYLDIQRQAPRQLALEFSGRYHHTCSSDLANIKAAPKSVTRNSGSRERARRSYSQGIEKNPYTPLVNVLELILRGRTSLKRLHMKHPCLVRRNNTINMSIEKKLNYQLGNGLPGTF